MKENVLLQEMASLNRAAFQVTSQEAGNGFLLEKLLTEVLGGIGTNGSCTEFTCNLYAP